MCGMHNIKYIDGYLMCGDITIVYLDGTYDVQLLLLFATTVGCLMRVPRRQDMTEASGVGRSSEDEGIETIVEHDWNTSTQIKLNIIASYKII